MGQDSGMQGLNVGSETWGGKGCIGEGEPFSRLCVFHLQKPSTTACQRAPWGTFKHVYLAILGVLVYLVISLVLKLSPSILDSSANQAAGGVPLLTCKR